MPSSLHASHLLYRSQPDLLSTLLAPKCIRTCSLARTAVSTAPAKPLLVGALLDFCQGVLLRAAEMHVTKTGTGMLPGDSGCRGKGFCVKDREH